MLKMHWPCSEGPRININEKSLIFGPFSVSSKRVCISFDLPKTLSSLEGSQTWEDQRVHPSCQRMTTAPQRMVKWRFQVDGLQSWSQCGDKAVTEYGNYLAGNWRQNL